MSMRRSIHRAAPRAFTALACLLALSGCSGSTTGPTQNPPPGSGSTTGTLQIVTSTDGLMIDPDGYTVAVGTKTLNMNPVDTASLDLAPGTVSIQLTGQADNCTPHAAPDTSAVITSGQTTQVVLAVTCFKDPIVFERYQPSGRRDIYMIDASGGTAVRLTDGPDEFNSALTRPGNGFVWNPAHTMIAFQSSGQNDFTEIDAYVMAINKSVIHHLVQSAPQFAPVWSPDGSEVAFGGYEPIGGGDYTSALHVAKSDLTGVTDITPGNAFWTPPSWSVDGTRLLSAVDSSQIGGPHGTVAIMNADGTGLVDISNAAGTRDTTLSDGSESWSPDNSKVVFVRSTLGLAQPFANDIWVVNQDGTGLTRLTTDSTIAKSSLMWSPDGSQIYFERCGDSDCNGRDVWRMNADGTGDTQVTTSGNEHLGSINPTGTLLVTWDVVGLVPGTQAWQAQMYVQALDGSNRTALSAAGLDAENPHWR